MEHWYAGRARNLSSGDHFVLQGEKVTVVEVTVIPPKGSGYLSVAWRSDSDTGSVMLECDESVWMTCSRNSPIWIQRGELGSAGSVRVSLPGVPGRQILIGSNGTIRVQTLDEHGLWQTVTRLLV